MRSKLNGYKTYCVGLVTALIGLYQTVHLGHLSTTSVSAFLAAGGLGALRASIKKVELAIKAAK